MRVGQQPPEKPAKKYPRKHKHAMWQEDKKQKRPFLKTRIAAAGYILASTVALHRTYNLNDPVQVHSTHPLAHLLVRGANLRLQTSQLLRVASWFPSPRLGSYMYPLNKVRSLSPKGSPKKLHELCVCVGGDKFMLFRVEAHSPGWVLRKKVCDFRADDVTHSSSFLQARQRFLLVPPAGSEPGFSFCSSSSRVYTEGTSDHLPSARCCFCRLGKHMHLFASSLNGYYPSALDVTPGWGPLMCRVCECPYMRSGACYVWPLPANMGSPLVKKRRASAQLAEPLPEKTHLSPYIQSLRLYLYDNV